MMVYIGDSAARDFTNASEPFAVPPGSNGLWNSLFIKNAVTVTAISGTTIDGAGGIWAIDGRLEYPDGPEQPEIETVVNSAGGPEGPVAPGEIVSISGQGWPQGTLQPDIGGVRVRFGGIPSPLAYVAAGKIRAIVPYGVSDSADVEVSYGGSRSYRYPLGVTPSAPEIFSGRKGDTQALARNQHGSMNSTTHPARQGSHIAFWATGQGEVGGTGGTWPVLPVRATVGGIEARVSCAALIAPGVLQVNIVIPERAPSGDAVELVLTIGSARNRNAATLAIE